MGADSLVGWSGLRVVVVKHRAAYKEQGRVQKWQTVFTAHVLSTLPELEQVTLLLNLGWL